MEYNLSYCSIAVVKDEKTLSGSIKIDPEVYKKVADYYQSKGIKITFFATETLSEKIEKLQKEKK